tara:strand:- start:206 stop:448 length:243 start_codon:yes stop_codon:yes gene_type:complete
MSKWINIRINADGGEAKVVLTDAFLEMDPLWQADILQDCSGDMDRLYKEAFERMRADSDKKRFDAETNRLVKELAAMINS